MGFISEGFVFLLMAAVIVWQIIKIKKLKKAFVDESGIYKKTEKRLLEANKELLTAQFQLLQVEKITFIGQLAGGIAHEINNPLTGVLNNVQLIKMMYGTPQELNQLELRELLDIVEESAMRCKKITDSLLDFSHGAIGVFQPISLNTIIERIIGLMHNEIKSQSISIQKDLQENLPFVQGDSLLLQQVIFNLISNAKGAIEKKCGISAGLVTIKTEFEPENQRVWVYISDNGIGIPDDKVGKIFEPFLALNNPGLGQA
jgi:signal transduction histidine kinase